MKIKYLKLRNWLLLSLMGLIGVTGCKSSKQTAASQNGQEQPVATVQDQPQDGGKKKKIDEGRGQVALMYGVPTMEYRIRGKVVNHQGKAVKGIQVVMLNREIGNTPNRPGEDDPYVEDYLKQYADTTKADGSFEIKAKDRPTEYMRVFVRDIDGPSNGNYQNDVINVEFTNDEVKSEGQGWNRGVAQKENFNIKLKPVR